ncbi:hypothetical protein BIW11_06212 [Tropilaelaps mercedesae]|uniref:Rad60/SUMO-like domain-containing protein n=1 Tax=Tropilaelaps mercedesae TaxID=418985 RepID=A0A1V9XZ16_9ACAR|nr:hypothetical protein BIW11_06212 [Tropilaelaps mercedesae]
MWTAICSDKIAQAKMTTGRTIHGLAGLITSDDSASDSDDSGTLVQNSEGKSVFDVPGIFNAEITRKLREGERLQLRTAAAAATTDETADEVIEIPNSPNSGSPSTRSLRQGERTLRARRRASDKRRNYKHLESRSDANVGGSVICLSDESDTDPISIVDRNGAGDGGKTFTSTGVPQTALESDLDISRRTDPDDEVDEEIYRVVVTQIGNNETLAIVRLTEKDLMKKVFVKAVSAAGKGGILMMGADDYRREVLAEDTVKSLGLSAECLARMEFVPIQAQSSANSTFSPGFTIKFITGNRRDTKEVRCKPDEPFGAIFERYCNLAGVKRSSVTFRFDDDVVEDGRTPEELDIDSGDLVEAHFQKENMTPSVKGGDVGVGHVRPQRKRSRQSYGC